MSLVMGSGLAGHLREERPTTTMRNDGQARAERKAVFGLLNRTTENGLAISATCPVVTNSVIACPVIALSKIPMPP
jgi:hypothetical protein